MIKTYAKIPRGSQLRRQLSSKIDLKKSQNSNTPPNPQPFVKVRLQPGESDPLSQIYKKPENPLYRPKWRNNAQIISAEDFAARPRVSFDEQFDSMHDAMVVLSWLDENQRQDIYQAYLTMMMEQEKEFKTTSHEYVMRVIAEKFNLTPERVAAVVQNCHDEEQAAKDGKLCDDKMAKYVDAKIKEHIENAYMAYGEVNPNQYVESPTAVADIGGESNDYVRVEDLYDVDDLTQKAILREQGEAQLLIDEKIYIEDVNNATITSKANSDTLKLIEKTNSELKEVKEGIQRNADSLEYALPDNGVIEDEEGNTSEAERRPRWKYVAQTVNVREQKKVGKKSRRGAKLQKHQMKDNTLVEEDGELRLATVEEVSQTPWAPEMCVNEKIYRGVKTAWLNRKEKKEQYGWGRVPENMKVKMEEEVEEEAANKNVEETPAEDASASTDGDDNKEDK